MSAPLVNKVRDLPAEWLSNATERLVLQNLAYDAGKDGQSAPGMDNLKRWVGRSESTIYAATKALLQAVDNVRPPLLKQVQEGRPGYRAEYLVLPYGGPGDVAPAGGASPPVGRRRNTSGLQEA